MASSFAESRYSDSSNTGGRSGGYDSNTGAPIPAYPSASIRPSYYSQPNMLSTSSGGGSVMDGSSDGGGALPTAITGTQTPTPTGPTAEEQAAAEKARIAALQQQAYDNAIAYGTQQITDRSLNQALVDQYGVLDAYKALVDQYKGTLDPTNANPAYATDTYFNDVLGTANNRYEADLRNQLNATYGDGFEYNAFGDTSDDAIIQAIIDQQKNDAQLTLDRAHARGQLNDVGYGRANTALGDQGKAATGTLQDIGGGVLADYRSQLSGQRSNILDSIGNANLSNPYDLTSATGRLDALRNNLSGSLENDIYRDLGGQNFFDPGTAISTGGNTQGTINPSRINFAENPLLQSFADAGRKTYASNTGSTATTGAF